MVAFPQLKDMPLLEWGEKMGVGGTKIRKKQRKSFGGSRAG